MNRKCQVQVFHTKGLNIISIFLVQHPSVTFSVQQVTVFFAPISRDALSLVQILCKKTLAFSDRPAERAGGFCLTDRWETPQGPFLHSPLKPPTHSCTPPDISLALWCCQPPLPLDCVGPGSAPKPRTRSVHSATGSVSGGTCPVWGSLLVKQQAHRT